MIKLFTSYYANYKNIPKSYLCIGISRYCPEWFETNPPDNFFFTKSNFLAPSEELLNDIKSNSITQEEYKKRYVTELYTNLAKIGYNDLGKWARDLIVIWTQENVYDGIVFMCYERPEEFCHRHIFRNILNKICNIECKEYGVKETIEPNKALF